MNKELNYLHCWLVANNLLLNVHKTEYTINVRRQKSYHDLKRVLKF